MTLGTQERYLNTYCKNHTTPRRQHRPDKIRPLSIMLTGGLHLKHRSVAFFFCLVTQYKLRHWLVHILPSWHKLTEPKSLRGRKGSTSPSSAALALSTIPYPSLKMGMNPNFFVGFADQSFCGRVREGHNPDMFPSDQISFPWFTAYLRRNSSLQDLPFIIFPIFGPFIIPWPLRFWSFGVIKLPGCWFFHSRDLRANNLSVLLFGTEVAPPCSYLDPHTLLEAVSIYLGIHFYVHTPDFAGGLHVDEGAGSKDLCFLLQTSLI